MVSVNVWSATHKTSSVRTANPVSSQEPPVTDPGSFACWQPGGRVLPSRTLDARQGRLAPGHHGCSAPIPASSGPLDGLVEEPVECTRVVGVPDDGEFVLDGVGCVVAATSENGPAQLPETDITRTDFAPVMCSNFCSLASINDVYQQVRS